MKNVMIRPINIIDNTVLPEVSVNQKPTDGDPIEISGEMYYVCDNPGNKIPGSPEIGVIPLVVRNPASVSNIEEYIKCLSIAHRKVRFRNENGPCDLDNCEEMIIS
jgi:hypothetical protein